MKYIYFFIFSFLMGNWANGQSPVCTTDNNIPYATNPTHITIWNGQNYVPVFLKGINLGVSVPGTFPGELAATRQDYWNWFEKIKNAGFNNIRVYTLHYPRFYQVLDSFNMQNPQNPLFVFHGIWLDEELAGYDRDLYSLTDTFNAQIEEIVDCIHGNRHIEPRFGKAFGNFNTDISKWVMGYIIGRELHPDEIMNSDLLHPQDTSFSSAAFSLASGSPSEVWITARLDHLVMYERNTYQTERPVSFSSWPTLDPIEHPTEFFWQDTAQIDLADIDFSLAPAGYFATFHAYPYYPDFISNDPGYQTFADYLGQNSYLGYLYDLKAHYNNYPLIIGEFGTPSSWGVAHYSFSGMHHGGMDEKEQGLYLMRLLDNIEESGCGGGMYFAWIDEWFKRNWITDPFDFPMQRRALWHNITAAEQNFGLIKFERNTMNYQLIDVHADTCPINEVYADADFTFLNLKLIMNYPFSNIDTLLLAFDTYSKDLGEAVLPGGYVIGNRAEFLLKITNFSAELFVTQAYDLFGIWHGISPPQQLYRSIPTDGGPWNIVRWKNNDPAHDIQYIGNLKVRRVELPPSSKDAVVISDDKIEIRIPWSLLNFIDPTSLRVMHDYRETPGTQDTLSDGINFTIVHDNCTMSSENRYVWEGWDVVEDIYEVEKQSLAFTRTNLPLLFNSNAIAVCDEYYIDHGGELFAPAEEGILANDFDLDGDYMIPILTGYPLHGSISLFPDGSFFYYPDPGFSGLDHFEYQIFDGMGHSDTSFAVIETDNTGVEGHERWAGVQVYPNPADTELFVVTEDIPQKTVLQIIHPNGQVLIQTPITHRENRLDVSSLEAGFYLLLIHGERSHYARKLIIY